MSEFSSHESVILKTRYRKIRKDPKALKSWRDRIILGIIDLNDAFLYYRTHIIWVFINFISVQKKIKIQLGLNRDLGTVGAAKDGRKQYLLKTSRVVSYNTSSTKVIIIFLIQSFEARNFVWLNWKIIMNKFSIDFKYKNKVWCGLFL